MKNNITDEQIIAEAQEYLKEEQSLRSVAKTFGLSHPSVFEHFHKKLIHIDIDLFEKVAEKMDKKKPKSIQDPIVFQRVLLVKNIFLTGNYTMNEIVFFLREHGWEDVDFFTVYRDLRVRIKNMLALFPNYVTNEEIETIDKIIEQHISANLTQKRL